MINPYQLRTATDRRSKVKQMIQDALASNQSMITQQAAVQAASAPAGGSKGVNLAAVGGGDNLQASQASSGGLNPSFETALNQLIADSNGKISISSGYRSPERQAQLWEEALQKYGDPEIADNWVARPGKSNHGRGIAADLRFADDAVRNWAHKNAVKYGLHFPMSWENWHIEPLKGGR